MILVGVKHDTHVDSNHVMLRSSLHESNESTHGFFITPMGWMKKKWVG